MCTAIEENFCSCMSGPQIKQDKANFLDFILVSIFKSLFLAPELQNEDWLIISVWKLLFQATLIKL